MEQNYQLKVDYQNKFAQLEKYREELYPILGKRHDASMDLIDALACKQEAHSVTELSEQPEFTRQYPSVRDAIHYAGKQQAQLKKHMQNWGIQQMPQIIVDNQYYNLYAIDSTPNAHPHAHCLEDRSYIHDASHKVTGKPINIGHQYSAIVGITEDRSWVSPVRMERIPTDEKPTEFGIKQALSVSEATPGRSISLLDSAYNTVSCLELIKESRDIFVIRSACNRKYYLPADPKDYKGRGRRPEYGKLIDIKNPQEGPMPDNHLTVKSNNHPGYIELYYWKKVLTKMKGMKGYEHPSSLVVLIEFREDGSMKYKNPWVIRVFDPTGEFNCSYGAWLYSFRFMIEGYFAVNKRKLLFNKFQSCEVNHQETFCLMGSLAYQQWYLAKQDGKMDIPVKPWMRYPKDKPKGLVINPGNTQRSFSKVLQQVGTPAVYRSPRGIPPGRAKGDRQTKRPMRRPIKKNIKASAAQEIDLPSAPGMHASVRNQAAKVAGDVIGQGSFRGKIDRITGVVISLVVSFLLNWMTIQDTNFKITIVQNIISIPSEFGVANSDDTLMRSNFDNLEGFFATGSRSPPNTS